MEDSGRVLLTLYGCVYVNLLIIILMHLLLVIYLLFIYLVTAAVFLRLIVCGHLAKCDLSVVARIKENMRCSWYISLV